MTKTRIVIAALLLAALSVGFALQSDTDHPPHVERPKAGVLQVGSPTAREVVAVGDVAAWIEGEHLARWYAGVTAAEEAARVAAARQAASVNVARTGTREGVGDCTGFAIPDHIIQRESGGNPHAINSSSGAFGCAQVMPMHWNPGGACAGLDRYSIDDQRTCVDWLSQGGTRLSPWAATR